MAISDRDISAAQEKLVYSYGSEILTLNTADQTFIIANGYVTGSDTLLGSTWTEYRDASSIADGFQWKVKDYLGLLGKLGILSKDTIDLKDRKARDLKTKDARAYAQVFAGKSLFTSADELQGAHASAEEVVAQAYADLSASIKLEFDRKMIESSFIHTIKRKSNDHTYYIRVKEGREIGLRSMQAQGFTIRKKNLATVSHSRGTYRGRFNTFNNNHNGFYASGSWKSGSKAGPRIQGHAGGVGSCKFVIINRSGSI